MNYQSGNADILESYVIGHYDLSSPTTHLYCGMRWLERGGGGLCKLTKTTYREIAKVASIDTMSVKKSLLELQQKGLIRLKIGCPIKSKRRKTEFTRLPLDEIKMNSIQGDNDGDRLSRALVVRAFSFNGNIIQPMWTSCKTGRVMSSKPNFQGINHDKRVSGLFAGLKKGQILIHADIKQADPTIIKHLLGIPKERNLYCDYMKAHGCPRSEAKKAVNILAYCRNTLAVVRHWPEHAQIALDDYVQKLSAYKSELFAKSRKKRSVTTLTGRVVVADKGRIHPGQYMNWRVQGTVADIINYVCLYLIDLGITVIPIHDAIYAVLPADRKIDVGQLIIDKAHEIGVPVELKTEVYPSVKLSGKPLQQKTS